MKEPKIVSRQFPKALQAQDSAQQEPEYDTCEPEIQTCVKIIADRLGTLEHFLGVIDEKFSPVMRASHVETVRTHSHVCVTAMDMSLEAFENRLQDAIEKLEDLAARCAV